MGNGTKNDGHTIKRQEDSFTEQTRVADALVEAERKKWLWAHRVSYLCDCKSTHFVEN